MTSSKIKLKFCKCYFSGVKVKDMIEWARKEKFFISGFADLEKSKEIDILIEKFFYSLINISQWTIKCLFRPIEIMDDMKWCLIFARISFLINDNNARITSKSKFEFERQAYLRRIMIFPRIMRLVLNAFLKTKILHYYNQLISYKRFLVCTLIQWRLSIYP